MAKDIAIIGAGAVGLFYGAKLQKSGANVQYQSRYVVENLTDDERENLLQEPYRLR